MVVRGTGDCGLELAMMALRTLHIPLSLLQSALDATCNKGKLLLDSLPP